MTRLEKAQAEFVELYAEAVRNNPECYKARVVADPEHCARRLVEGLDLTNVRQLIRDQRDENRQLAALT